MTTTPSAPATVTDDDGVLVLVDASALRDAAATGFDGDFPGTLGQLVRAGRAVAWQTESEGNATLALRVASELPRDATGPWRLDVESGPFYFLPYSQFTMSVAHRGGEIERITGLFAELPVPIGSYRVWVARTVGDGSWNATLVPCARVSDTDASSLVEDVRFIAS